MSAETTDAQPTPRTSSRFGDESAPDVVPFVSSDGMRLYIERAKLEREADAFPPPSATLAPGEVVPLEEDGDTLELLFRFIDREEFVRMEDVEFDLLARVAEAAHKYRVYSAMSICRLHMSAQHAKHPLSVLAYALKHGHSDIADAAAPYTVGSRANEMLKVLPSHQEYIRWTLYNDMYAALYMNITSHRPEMAGHWRNCRTVWSSVETELLAHMHRAGGVRALEALKEPFEAAAKLKDSQCFSCPDHMKVWRSNVEEAKDRISPFSQVLVSL